MRQGKDWERNRERHRHTLKAASAQILIAPNLLQLVVPAAVHSRRQSTRPRSQPIKSNRPKPSLGQTLAASMRKTSVKNFFSSTSSRSNCKKAEVSSLLHLIHFIHWISERRKVTTENDNKESELVSGLCHIGNTSSNLINEVDQIGPG